MQTRGGDDLVLPAVDPLSSSTPTPGAPLRIEPEQLCRSLAELHATEQPEKRSTRASRAIGSSTWASSVPVPCRSRTSSWRSSKPRPKETKLHTTPTPLRKPPPVGRDLPGNGPLCFLFPRPRKPGSTKQTIPRTVTNLNFLVTTGRRERFLTAFENYGEVLEERAGEVRYFDLRPSGVIGPDGRPIRVSVWMV